MGFPGSSAGKESACSVGDPESERFPGEGNSYLLQYFGLENSMDRGAWWAAVHGFAESRTWLSDFHFQGLTREHKSNEFIPFLYFIHTEDPLSKVLGYILEYVI